MRLISLLRFILVKLFAPIYPAEKGCIMPFLSTNIRVNLLKNGVMPVHYPCN